jgi:hypothetical protein
MSLIDLNKEYLHSASASTNKDHFRLVPELVQPECLPVLAWHSLAQTCLNVQ